MCNIERNQIDRAWEILICDKYDECESCPHRGSRWCTAAQGELKRADYELAKSILEKTDKSWRLV